MRSLIAWLRSLFFLLPGVCTAVIFHDIDTTASLPCTLSSTHQNRILVNEGRIAKVVFPEGSLLVQMEEESGQAFICAGANITEKTTITVITENGFVQDIEVQFENSSSEVIVLREEKQRVVEKKPESWEKMEYLLQKILKEEVPKGYSRFNWRCQRKIGSLLVYTLASFEGIEETIYLYKVKNTKLRKACVNERWLAIPGSIWVHLEREVMGPGEEIWAVQAVRRR